MKNRILGVLLCLVMFAGLIPAGAATVTVFAEEEADYSDPEHPYIATDYMSMQKIFSADNSDNPKTVYIKLGSNIYYESHSTSIQHGDTVTHFFPNDRLVTNHTRVYLDLAGYTLSYKTDFAYSFISAGSGRITIKDSGRYDPATGLAYLGRIEFLRTTSADETCTYALSGPITVESGTIVNKTHSNVQSHWAYYGSQLCILGGTLEADTPIYLKGNTSGGFPYLYILGGQLRAKNSPAIEIRFSEAELNKITRFAQWPDNYYADTVLPQIKACEIVNASGKSEIDVFKITFPTDKYDESGEHIVLPDEEQAGEMLDNIICPSSWAYIDGVKQPYQNLGVTQYVDHVITGPKIHTSYVLTEMEYISKIELTIPQPKLGEKVTYSASVPGGRGYGVLNQNDYKVWKSGVMWAHNNTALEIDDTRKYGKTTYTVNIAVGISSSVGTTFDYAEYLSATVNGKPARVIRVSDTSLIVQYDYDFSSASVIKKIELTVPEPEGDKPIDYAATVPSGAAYSVSDYSDGEVWLNGVKWANSWGGGDLEATNAGIFEYGFAYTAHVRVEVNDTDKNSFEDVSKISATINGRKATVEKLSDSVYIVSLETEVPTVISYIALNVPTPKAGALMEYIAWGSENEVAYEVEDYTQAAWVNGVAWLDKDMNFIDPSLNKRFEIGYYYVFVSLVPTYTSTFSFAAPEEITATINGYKASIQKYSDTNYGVFCRIPVTESDPVIDLVELTVPEPAAGAKISYDVVVPQGLGYAVEKDYGGNDMIAWYINWTLLDKYSGNKFEPGWTYRMNVFVEITEPGHKFADDCKATVNGKEARFVKLTYNGAVSGYSVEYTVEIPDPNAKAKTVVDKIAVAVAEPVAGAAMPYTVGLTGEGYETNNFNTSKYANGVAWAEEESSYFLNWSDSPKFEAGKSYILRVYVRLSDTEEYIFADEDKITATVNGKPAEAVREGLNAYIVKYTFTVPEGGAAQDFIPGDVNGNGKIDSADYAMCKRAFLKTYELSAEQLLRADINKNGKVDSSEYAMIKRHFLKTYTIPGAEGK